MTRFRTCALLLVAALALACNNVTDRDSPPAGGYLTPTPIPTVPIADDIVAFRVDGDHPSALVHVSNSLDGLSQVNAVLPFYQEMSVRGRDSIFLSIDARGSAYGFLHVAIFVNGVLFREASSSTMIPSPFVSVSGTWRRAR